MSVNIWTYKLFSIQPEKIAFRSLFLKIIAHWNGHTRWVAFLFWLPLVTNYIVPHLHSSTHLGEVVPPMLMKGNVYPGIVAPLVAVLAMGDPKPGPLQDDIGPMEGPSRGVPSQFHPRHSNWQALPVRSHSEIPFLYHAFYCCDRAFGATSWLQMLFGATSWLQMLHLEVAPNGATSWLSLRYK